MIGPGIDSRSEQAAKLQRDRQTLQIITGRPLPTPVCSPALRSHHGVQPNRASPDQPPAQKQHYLAITGKLTSDITAF